MEKFGNFQVDFFRDKTLYIKNNWKNFERGN